MGEREERERVPVRVVRKVEEAEKEVPKELPDDYEAFDPIPRRWRVGNG